MTGPPPILPPRGDAVRPAAPSSSSLHVSPVPAVRDDARPGRDLYSDWDSEGCWDECGCYYTRPSQHYSAAVVAWCGGVILCGLAAVAVYALVAAVVDMLS